jgi:hypothetical protein
MFLTECLGNGQVFPMLAKGESCGRERVQEDGRAEIPAVALT